MFQSWCTLTFLHWRYPIETVRTLVPPPLELEAFDGSAWVAITPFVLRDKTLMAVRVYGSFP
jgi:hypothetical protein